MTEGSSTNRRLILVKHSLPAVDPLVTAANWRLSPEGIRRCAGLAARLATHHPTRVIASQEPKAAQTGELVAAQLGISSRTAPNLHEHDRTGVPWLGEADFVAAVAALFQRPGERVYGQESARAALARFESAVDDVVAEFPAETLILVAHGTVIALLLSARAGIDGFDLWQRLGLPSFVVVELPTFTIVETGVNIVGGPLGRA